MQELSWVYDLLWVREFLGVWQFESHHTWKHIDEEYASWIGKYYILEDCKMYGQFESIFFESIISWCHLNSNEETLGP